MSDRSIRARVGGSEGLRNPERTIAFGIGHMVDVRITPDEAWELADKLTAACVEAGAFRATSDITREAGT